MPTNISYVANGLNQYTSTNAGAAPVTYGYDANGNLSSDGVTTYGYDTENRMVTAASAGGTVTMRYDPLGRLYEVTAANGNKRRLYYSGDALIAEYDGAGTMLNRYVHGLSGGDDPLVQFNGSGVALADAYFLSSDPRGSIVLTSRQNGATPTINSYDEYGVPGTSNTGRFQYTGQAWVPELGMFYYKARMYSPTLGRFMQTDPIGRVQRDFLNPYLDGMNIYAYAGGDPVNGVDSTGLGTIRVTHPRCGGMKHGFSCRRDLDRINVMSGDPLTSQILTANAKETWANVALGMAMRAQRPGRYRVPSAYEARQNKDDRERENCQSAGVSQLLHEAPGLSRVLTQMQANHSSTGNEWGLITDREGNIVYELSEGASTGWDAPVMFRLLRQRFRALGADYVMWHSHSDPGLSEDDLTHGSMSENDFGFGEPMVVAMNGGVPYCSRGGF